MHTMEWYSNWSANFNGDFSGDVHFVTPLGEHVVIPYFAVEAVVAEKVRRDRNHALDGDT